MAKAQKAVLPHAQNAGLQVSAGLTAWLLLLVMFVNKKLEWHCWGFKDNELWEKKNAESLLPYCVSDVKFVVLQDFLKTGCSANLALFPNRGRLVLLNTLTVANEQTLKFLFQMFL